MLDKKEFMSCFRPLSGYLISKYELFPKKRKSYNVFPSPLGVSYFQIFLPESSLKMFVIVSVPSRGILFPNRDNS